MTSNISIFSEKLHSCGASIAALRSANSLSSHISNVEYIFEKSENFKAVKSLYPGIYFRHVTENYVKSYRLHLEKQRPDVAILHNFRHSLSVVETLCSISPLLWMMHDASPVTGMNYALANSDRSEVIRYLNSKGIPDPIQFEKLARRPFAFASPSKWLKDVAENYLDESVPVFHIRNSVPQNYFFQSEKAAARGALGLPQDKFTILFSAGTGAIVRKNLKLIMDALAYIPDPDIRFVVLGGVPIEHAVTDHRLIYLPSFSPQLQPLMPAQLYSAADAFVIPSLADNLPNTVLESYFCGTPVIGSSAGGIPEMIKENETGWLINPRDPEGLGRLISELSQKPDLIQQYGRAGKDFITSEYSDAASAADYLKAIDYLDSVKSRNFLTNANDLIYARRIANDPLHISHTEPFYDVRRPVERKQQAIARSLGRRADSHMAPYRKFWNPSRDELNLLSFRYRMASLGFPVTENEKRINSWYNAHRGQRAFLIGNGPSLNHCDLSLLRNEITIGVNSIFMKKDELGGLPTHFVVEDNFVAEDRADQINALTGTNKWFGNYLCYCLKGEDVNWLNVRMRYDAYPGFPYFSVDAGRQLWTGGSVTYLCMQLAFYFGIKELYLIGFDHHYEVPKETLIEGYAYTSQVDDPNHFDSSYFGKGYRWHAPMTERMELGYLRAGKTFERFGRKIYNATVGGKLEVLPRVDYTSLF